MGRATAPVLDLFVARAKEYLRLEARLEALREEMKVLLRERQEVVEVEGQVFGLFPVVTRDWDMTKTLVVLRRHKVPLADVLEVSSKGEKALLGDPDLVSALAGCFVEKQYSRFGHRKKGV